VALALDLSEDADAHTMTMSYHGDIIYGIDDSNQPGTPESTF
jgi:hypothetical protein